MTKNRTQNQAFHIMTLLVIVIVIAWLHAFYFMWSPPWIAWWVGVLRRCQNEQSDSSRRTVDEKARPLSSGYPRAKCRLQWAIMTKPWSMCKRINYIIGINSKTIQPVGLSCQSRMICWPWSNEPNKVGLAIPRHVIAVLHLSRICWTLLNHITITNWNKPR